MDYNPYHLSSLLGGLQFVDSNIHEISGTVTLPDSRTIVINDFNYDGLGVGKRECYILVCKINVAKVWSLYTLLKIRCWGSIF